MVYQRKPFGPAHGPDLSEKIPIHCQLTDFLKQMRQQGFIRRRSIGRTALVRAKSDAVPPSKVFFQAWI